MQTPPQSPSKEQIIPNAPVKKKVTPVSSYRSWTHFIKKIKAQDDEKNPTPIVLDLFFDQRD